jgi:hypothetical protein
VCLPRLACLGCLARLACLWCLARPSGFPHIM